MNVSTLEQLRLIKGDIEQAAREIYYAMSFLEQSNPARANLGQALRCLGVTHPFDVGLSSSVLEKKK